MKIRDLAYETASALDANRGRSLLTILGIVIGIGAVIAMTALIDGIKLSMVGELGLNQARLVQMYAWPARGVTIDDVEALEERMPDYECLSASTYTNFKAMSDTKSCDCDIQGTLPNYHDVMGIKILQGSYFTEKDQDEGALVIVVDQNLVKLLFGDRDASVVGKSIQVNNQNFRIVGVCEATSSYSQESGSAYVPFSTCASRLSGNWNVDNLMGLAREDADMTTIAETTTAALAEYFQMDEEQAEEELYVFTMQSIIDELNTTMGAFEIMMTAVASISLLVGGIGIMNMMLTNVTERIREIGLRKALGARSSDITKQFLLESICLCVVGGIFGIGLGYLGSFALTGLAGGAFSVGSETNPVVPVISMRSVGMATGICILIGVLFGYYPARRAAKLDPVESLHYQ